MEEKCVNCKYYREGICMVPLWVEGGYVQGTPVKEDNRCWLFEEKAEEQ